MVLFCGGARAGNPTRNFQDIFCHFLAINCDIFALIVVLFAVFMDFSCHARAIILAWHQLVCKKTVVKTAEIQLLTQIFCEADL